MLSYNHIYHAGCVADVFKHTVLALILTHMNAKDKPYTVLDTHAGRGAYDLCDERALKTGEADCGIRCLLRYMSAHEAPASLKPYLSVLSPLITSRFPLITSYYGSPMIEYSLMRSSDSLILCELHPTEIVELRRNMKALRQSSSPALAIHHRDGYEAATALTPPAVRRGMLFIDPSYEDEWEYDKVSGTLKNAVHRWPQAVIALWYPVLDKRIKQRENMLHSIKALVPQEKVLDINMTAEHVGLAMRASGMLVINPPYQLKEEIVEAGNFITSALGQKSSIPYGTS